MDLEQFYSEDEHRRHSEQMVTRVVQTMVPNEYGHWTAIGYLNNLDGTEHLALVLGDISAADALARPDVLVRMHSECLTGDVLGVPMLEAVLGQPPSRKIVCLLRNGHGHQLRGPREGHLPQRGPIPRSPRCALMSEDVR